MHRRKPASWLAAIFALALFATACGGDEPGDGEEDGTTQPQGQATETQTGEEEVPEGGTFATELTEPTYLAPFSNCYESECASVMSVILDPLVSVDFETGELTYDGLLESVESNEDQTVWTLTIKDGRKFHNGEPVDADAFLRAWNYSQDPDNAQATAGFLARIKGAGKGPEMRGLRKIDDLTLEVTLNGPFSQFGQQLGYTPAFSPIAEECLESVKQCNEQPIGTGHYQMQGKWRHDRGITVTKWADYQGEQPATADTIEFQMFTNPTAAFRDFQNGGVDVISVAPEVYLQAQGAGIEMIEQPTSTLTYLGFPVQQEPYDSKQFRQAVSLSIDRQLIVDQVLNGLAQPSTDIVTPPIPGSRDDACEYCTFDPQRAKELLETSGVNTDNLTMQLYFNADAGHDVWVEAVGRQIQENLGIDYELNSTEWAQYLELLDAQEFDGPFRLGWIHDYPSPENYIRPIVGTGGDSNYTGYSNPQLDQLLEQADAAPTVEEAIELYQQAGDVALEDMPIIPMWSGVTAIAASDEVTNVRYDMSEGDIAWGEVAVVQ